MPKKFRRRGSKKTSDLITAVTTSTVKDDFENPSHQALQPRPTLDALLVSLNFACIKNVFDSVFYSHFKLKFFKHVLHKLYSGVLHVRKRSGKKPWNFILSHGKLACIKKSQGKLMSVATKIFLIRQTVFFSTYIWETVLFISCDESHTMTVLIFLFLVIFFYIGLKLI